MIDEASDNEQLQALLEAVQPQDAYVPVDRVFAPGWDDPAMDDYDRYEELKN